MFTEVDIAVKFLVSFLYNKLPRRKISLFAEQLTIFLIRKYQNHWYTDEPQKGSVFRCIRVNQDGLTDALLATASQCVGIEIDDLLNILPSDLTLWVDPGEVVFRIGERSTVQVLYKQSQSQASTPEQPPIVPYPMLLPETPVWSAQVTQQKDAGWSSTNDCLGLMSNPWRPQSPPPAQSMPTALPVPAPNTQFTVGTFAMTRFGTTKLKSAVLNEVKIPGFNCYPPMPYGFNRVNHGNFSTGTTPM